MDEHKKLFEVFSQQEYKRGTGGVLYIKDQECSYLFPAEFPNKDFANKLQDVLEEKKENIYFVVEKEQNLHLIAYPRKSVLLSQIPFENTVNDKTNKDN